MISWDHLIFSGLHFLHVGIVVPLHFKLSNIYNGQNLIYDFYKPVVLIFQFHAKRIEVVRRDFPASTTE